MSVLIKGMEMPKECRECPMMDYGTMTGETYCEVNGKTLAESYRTIEFDGRPDWCPLVELPEKHGRLIDADALVPDICHDWNGWCVPPDDYSEECIRKAPTVIEAEGET